MSATTATSALYLRTSRGWRTLSREAYDARVREYAHGWLELGCGPDAVLALEADGDGELLMVAAAALQAGITVQLGGATTPFDAAFAQNPARAAELATQGGIDQTRVPVPTAQDAGASLERLAAHGVLHAALRADQLRERRAARAGDEAAIIGPSGTAFGHAQVAAGVQALRNVGDLFRPGEPVLIATPVREPWLLTLALAALSTGAPVAIGELRDAAELRPGVIVAPAASVLELAEGVASEASRRARRNSLRLQRGAALRASVVESLARRLGLDRGHPAARCLIAVDGTVPRQLCTTLHASGTTVLHGAAVPSASALIVLNRPHRYRFDAVGLPLPDHDVLPIAGGCEIRGPAVVGGVSRTTLPVREGPDGFLVPASR